MQNRKDYIEMMNSCYICKDIPLPPPLPPNNSIKKYMNKEKIYDTDKTINIFATNSIQIFVKK